MRWIVSILLAAVLAGGPTAFAAAEPGTPGLDAMAAQIGRLELLRAMSLQPRPLIIDVRATSEFAVSRLPGARRVDAETDKEAFAADIAAAARGRAVVFYCTTSGRSEVFANAVLHTLMERGSDRIAVLAGGIVGWSNAGLPLVSGNGPTRLVHPHDPVTGRLLIRSETIRFEPR